MFRKNGFLEKNLNVRASDLSHALPCLSYEMNAYDSQFSPHHLQENEFVYFAVEICHRGPFPSATPGFCFGKNFANRKTKTPQRLGGAGRFSKSRAKSMGRTWEISARICLLCGRNLSSRAFAQCDPRSLSLAKTSRIAVGNKIFEKSSQTMGNTAVSVNACQRNRATTSCFPLQRMSLKFPLYYIALHCVVLYCIALYCIVFCCM